MRKIVFASWNSKKAAEIQRMTPEGIKFVCLKDIPEAADVPQAEENGTTFKENAGQRSSICLFWQKIPESKLMH